MSGLNLQNLKNYRDEILKAEIGALLFNLGKTHIGSGFWRNYFQHLSSNFKWSKYKNYITNNYFNKEIKEVSSILESFFDNIEVNIDNIIQLKIKEIMLGGDSDKDFVKKIFFRGCENINSGIDKGNPVEQLKPPLWLSNAFGSFKHKIEEKDFDDARIEFFRDLNCFLQRNNDYNSQNWQEIRRFIFDRVNPWYSKLLSDSRYPVNDVSLWDQAYMTASMFKAVLSNLILNDSKLQVYQDRPSSIRWRILGIQYDKLGLAEKGYKPAHISWYRDIAKEIDDEIKKLLEYEYPIGNEVYRDETGIYFIVGEDLGKGKEDLGEDKDNLTTLRDGLKDIKEEILKIFKIKSSDEFYPAIFLTKASRGLMNLTYLLEKARENFLKSDWSEKKKIDSSANAIGICQVCKQRLVFEDDKRDDDKNICKICYEEKRKGRIDKWLNNRAGETIWTAELKDKNDRLALVVMKFELMDWLNGDLLNSELIRCLNFGDNNDKFYEIKNEIESILKYIKEELSKDEVKKLTEINNGLESKIKNFLNIYDYKGIYKPFDEIYKSLKQNKNITNITKENNYQDLSRKLLTDDEILKHYKFFDAQQNITVNKKKKRIFPKNAYITEDASKDHLYKIITINYLLLQIYNTLHERSIGDRWEEFIYKALGDWDEHNKKPLKNKIDFDNRKIEWNQLTNKDIEFLSNFILQFLLRKNPSPARIRRIWESTQEFFKEIEEQLLSIANIPDNRRVRLFWENANVDTDYEGEAVYNNLEFWIKDKKCYLITYDSELIDKKLEDEDKELTLKLENGKTIDLNLKDSKIEIYKPYMSIIEPTPISWQFIIPAEYVPELIKNTQNLYDEYFKYVYGKLPLHIGVIIKDYKKPLYVGINALRKIRRDVKDRKKIWVEIEAKVFKEIFNDKIKKQKIEKECNNPVEYYSLYFDDSSSGDYKFYVSPDNSPCLMKNVDRLNNDEKINYIPNSFDFEFLDTNTRRNDIYYDESKNYTRKADLKTNKPYNIEKHFDIFKKFKESFQEGTSTSKLHNIINILYEKAILKEDLDDETKKFLASVIINTLEPSKSEKVKEFIRKWLSIESKDITYNAIESSITKEKLKIFLDMFEFWHKALKEV